MPANGSAQTPPAPRSRPDAQRPADSGRPDRGRIERRRQRVGGNLAPTMQEPAQNSEAEGRSNPKLDSMLDGLLRCARNDGVKIFPPPIYPEVGESGTTFRSP